jgi:hypothetical protein
MLGSDIFRAWFRFFKDLLSSTQQRQVAIYDTKKKKKKTNNPRTEVMLNKDFSLSEQ